MGKTELQEVPKSYSNKIDINKTEYSDTESNETDLSETEKFLSNPILSAEVEGHPDGMDTIGKMDAYRELIRERIEYPCYECKEVDELVELVVEVLMMPEDSTIRIAGVEKPVPLVSLNTVSRIEGGQSDMSIGVFRRLAQALGMSASELMGDMEVMQEDGDMQRMSARMRRLQQKDREVVFRTVAVLVDALSDDISEKT